MRSRKHQRVRDWALALGYQLSGRGPIPIPLLERYNREHPSDPVEIRPHAFEGHDLPFWVSKARIGGLSRHYGPDSPITEAARYEQDR